MWKNKRIRNILLLALTIKVLLLAITSFNPRGRIEIDSNDYLANADMIYTHGVFARSLKNDVFAYETYRTPGYPLFLALFHEILRIPLGGIAFLQILLTFASAFFIYKAALEINERIGLVSMVIILFDPSITLRSLMILTESLFLFLLCVFLYVFVLYLKTNRLSYVCFAAILVSCATYVRPVSYYLGFVLSFFILYAALRRGPRKFAVGFLHAVLFFVLTYGPIAAWHHRNYVTTKQHLFSSITNATIQSSHARGLIKSYTRNEDPFSQNLPPVAYYFNVTSRCLLSLLTRPASFKYFEIRPLTVAGKIFAYPWIIFWLLGFIFGMMKMRDNIYYHFMFYVAGYFIVCSVAGSMWGSGSRFRVPLMPFVAILSSFGWTWIQTNLRSRKKV